MEEKKLKYINVLDDALDFLPTKVAEIMDELDVVIEKTSDEKIVKDLNYIWMELDALKIELVNCSKFFKFLQTVFLQGQQ
jgi:predicted Zn-dependent protease with MMP-like domain